ncbi:hypothetical protein A9K55_001562 [Cordyceps militaris]|uniref:Uncharacterized protein n=1 Tax=Cordyceps militaris TaxID=73501 RepID=A0A2H4SQJ8_CORMI|nr:hypothetical protein A9K55_001562 [Cordyceps militaris]
MAVLQIRGGLHRAHEIFPPNLLGAASTPNGRNGSCDELPSTTGPFLGALDRPRHEVNYYSSGLASVFSRRYIVPRPALAAHGHQIAFSVASVRLPGTERKIHWSGVLSADAQIDYMPMMAWGFLAIGAGTAVRATTVSDADSLLYQAAEFDSSCVAFVLLYVLAPPRRSSEG